MTLWVVQQENVSGEEARMVLKEIDFIYISVKIQFKIYSFQFIVFITKITKSSWWSKGYVD